MHVATADCLAGCWVACWDTHCFQAIQKPARRAPAAGAHSFTDEPYSAVLWSNAGCWCIALMVLTSTGCQCWRRRPLVVVMIAAHIAWQHAMRCLGSLCCSCVSHDTPSHSVRSSAAVQLWRERVTAAEAHMPLYICVQGRMQEGRGCDGCVINACWLGALCDELNRGVGSGTSQVHDSWPCQCS